MSNSIAPITASDTAQTLTEMASLVNAMTQNHSSNSNNIQNPKFSEIKHYVNQQPSAIMTEEMNKFEKKRKADVMAMQQNLLALQEAQYQKQQSLQHMSAMVPMLGMGIVPMFPNMPMNSAMMMGQIQRGPNASLSGQNITQTLQPIDSTKENGTSKRKGLQVSTGTKSASIKTEEKNERKASVENLKRKKTASKKRKAEGHNDAKIRKARHCVVERNRVRKINELLRQIKIELEQQGVHLVRQDKSTVLYEALQLLRAQARWQNEAKMMQSAILANQYKTAPGMMCNNPALYGGMNCNVGMMGVNQMSNVAPICGPINSA